MTEFAEFRPEATQERWDLRTRRAVPSDVPFVASIHSAREGLPLDTSEHTISQWLDETARPFVVAEHKHRIVGFATATLLTPEDDRFDAPAGWYLTGLVVPPPARRHGVGRRLTEERLRRIRGRADEAWYVANERNRVSIALHEQLGFVEHTRDFTIPGIDFAGGTGILFRTDLG